MPCFARDPLPASGKVEHPRRVPVAAQRAVNGDEAVADKSVLEAGEGAGRRRGDRVAGDAFRQGNGAAGVRVTGEAIAAPPILVHEGPVAQVSYARAADLAEPAEGCRIGRLAQNDVDPIADALERRAVVRRAEKTSLRSFRRH